MPFSAPRSQGWSKLNVSLHWFIVALIVIQYVDHEWMVALWRATRRGTEIAPSIAAGGWLHIVAGTLVLLAAILRLWDRYRHGRPPYPAEEPNWATLLAKVTHFLIYAILILMPLAGLIAWFANNHEIGEIHTILWTPLLILVGLHVLGALAQQFWFRTDVLKRIVRPV